MLLNPAGAAGLLADGEIPSWLYNTMMFVKVLIGFSVIIFFHELGHFLAAKWVGVRVDRFAVGFGPRLFGYRGGEGFTFGTRPEYRAPELQRLGYGETDYCFRAFPIGGYVKMLGQDDVIIDEKSGNVQMTDDPRAFTSKPVGKRMIVVSAGVVFNLLLAALLLICIFMVGKQEEAPLIGIVPPESPAAGKLMPGDRVLEVNGQHIDSFNDIQIAAIMAGISSDGELNVTIMRDGERIDDIKIQAQRDPRVGATLLDVSPYLDPVLARDAEPVDDLPAPKKDDRITRVSGEPVETYLDIMSAFMTSRGEVLKLTVERTDPADPTGRPITVECYQRPSLVILPAQLSRDPEDTAAADSKHLLGLQPRQRVLQVIEGMPAERAGFKVGDVIVEWGTVPNPLYGEILESITASAGKPLRVVVLRDGERVTLEVTPERPFSVTSTKRAQVGIVFGNEEAPIIADVADDTPAADLNPPRGARITAVDDVPVRRWSDVVQSFFAAAGHTVRVYYESGGDLVQGPMEIPSSIVNELDLPPTARVLSLDGEESIRERDPKTGQTITHRLANNPWALGKLLESKVGRTVEVRFTRALDGPIEVEPFTVRQDNVDPWQMRIQYLPRGLYPETRKEIVGAGGNPFKAVMMSVREVRWWVYSVYAFLRGLFVQRSVSVEHVSGPVGIVGAAVDRAKAGLLELMYFLAFLSVNLAVINFLPIPVMDGGLMVFLLIEKIKGKPLSLKTQMISTLVGLAALILIGLFVTYQDIGRLFGS